MIDFKIDLLVGAALASIGIWGALSQRGIVMIVMAIELILIAANLEMLTFWRYSLTQAVDAHVFGIVVLTIAAVEEAFGLGIALMVFRRRRTQNVDRFRELSG